MHIFFPAFLAFTLTAQSAVEKRLVKDLQYLAGPERKGRGNGYPELDQAAEFIAKTYGNLGIKTQFQRFPFVASMERLEAQIRVIKGKNEAPTYIQDRKSGLSPQGEEGELLPLVWGKDVEAYGFSADTQFQNKAITFLGFGIQTQGYDDFAGLDLRNRVVLIARSVPEIPAFASLERGQRSLLARLQRLEQAGVAAVIVLEDEGDARPLHREEGPSTLRIPVLSMPTRVLQPVCGGLADSIQVIRNEGKPQSRDFIYAPGTYVNLTLKLKRTETQIPNVAAVIPGSDPKMKAEFIALGAHLDHLGLGERHSMAGEEGRGMIHPGADDNASGTAMLMELARRFKKQAPKRSVLLLHFAGEEEGLLGSGHWIKHPTQNLSSVKFFANFDMVGRLDKNKPRLFLGGLGAPKEAMEKAKTLAPIHLPIAQDLGFAVGGSDHMSFATAKIPTFFFFTGIHGDYHRPTDTPERLNMEGMAAVTGYAEKVIRDLADGAQVPAFDPETAKLPTNDSRGHVRIYFGTIPDFAEHPKGFQISGTTPGTTAESVGLKAGDVIFAFGNHPVKNIYDYMGALSAFQVGEKVIVKWLRGDQEMSAEATLRARK